jgi:hypothetical protein
MPRFPTTTPRLRVLLSALGVAVACGAAPAAGQELRLQGLFCNAEDQLDRALARIGGGLDPRLAAELENRDAVACTWVDRLHYLVRHPVRVGAVRYEATLTGVVVGGAVRPVSPPVRVFFATHEPVAAAAVERRT